MKRMMMLGAVAVILAAPAWAFHDDGVADCAGCHTMHNSQEGVGVAVDAAGNIIAPGSGNEKLLLYPNPTDVCLDCHAGNNNRYDVWSDIPHIPNIEYGGGDFIHLEEADLNDGHGGDIEGYEAGHSLISNIKGTVADPAHMAAGGTSPGGDYPVLDMHCTSCHDPHGTASFRLLWQDGQESESFTQNYDISWNVTMQAVGIGLRTDPNAPDDPGQGPERNDHHNVYQTGYSGWCGTCHGDFHNGGTGNGLIHPSGTGGVLDSDLREQYNRYTGSSDCAGIAAPCGNGDLGGVGSYLAQVPFEDPGRSDTESDLGAGTTSRVVCVTCHRAHASSGPDSGRWDFNLTGMEEDGGGSDSWPIPNQFDVYQRSLCNKCHAKDEFDALVDFTP